MSSDWTPEREAKLKTLWTQGLSCSQIAREIGGVSRNAVIGKRVRMGLPDRASPNRTYGTRTKPKARAMRVPKAPRETLTTPSAGPPKLKADNSRLHGAPKVGPRSVRHMDRYKYQCAMFCEGEEGATGFVCGEPTDGESAWCKSCERIVYAPTQAKAAAA